LFFFFFRNIFQIFSSERPFIRFREDMRTGEWKYISYIEADKRIQVLEQGLRDIGFVPVCAKILLFLFPLIMIPCREMSWPLLDLIFLRGFYLILLVLNKIL